MPSPRTPSILAVDDAHLLCARRLRGLHPHSFVRNLTVADEARARAVTVAYLWLEVLGPACLPRPRGHAQNVGASLAALDRWLAAAERCRTGRARSDNAEEVALSDTFARFDLPASVWSHVAESLARVATGEPVRDLSDLVEAARGLGSAPAGVFLRIVASKKGVRRYHLAPELDANELAHDMGVFAYTVQMMSGIFADVDAPDPRTMVPLELLDRNGLSVQRLQRLRDHEEASEDFLGLMSDLNMFARRFHQSCLAKLTQAAAHFPPEAVRHLDQFLAHYIGVLKQLKDIHYAPRAFPRPRRQTHPGSSLPTSSSRTSGSVDTSF